MNEEEQKTAVPYQLQEENAPRNKKMYVLAAVAAVILVVGGYFLYTNVYGSWSSNSPADTTKGQKRVQKDDIFLRGFVDTGRNWQPEAETWKQELKNNPLLTLREAYCNRVGYKYADFGGDCFFYQYYESYKTYRDEQERFTVYYPTLWQNDPEPRNYGFVAAPKASFQRQGVSCALTYGVIDEKAVVSSGETSTTKVNYGFGKSEDVSEELGLPKITKPFDRQLTDEEKAAGYTDAQLIAVPHFPYPNSTHGFILSSGKKQPLVEACVDELFAILNSRSIQYSAASLTPESNGVLSLPNAFSLFEMYASIPQKKLLLFNNFETKKEESVVPNAFQDILEVTDPFLSGGKLYFMNGGENPEIMSISISTDERTTLPLNYNADTPVHSFFVKGNDLYYLVGESCNEYLSVCRDMQLLNYNLTTGATVLLARGLEARDINGFDLTGTKLILRASEGDGGCLWGEYWEFALSSKTVRDLGSYTSCVDDTEDTFAPFRDLVEDTDSFGYLIVKDGKIFAPSSERAYPSGIYIRVNTSEYPREQ